MGATEFFELREKKMKKDESASTRPVGFAAGKNVNVELYPWLHILAKKVLHFHERCQL